MVFGSQPQGCHKKFSAATTQMQSSMCGQKALVACMAISSVRPRISVLYDRRLWIQVIVGRMIFQMFIFENKIEHENHVFKYLSTPIDNHNSRSNIFRIKFYSLNGLSRTLGGYGIILL